MLFVKLSLVGALTLLSVASGQYHQPHGFSPHHGGDCGFLRVHPGHEFPPMQGDHVFSHHPLVQPHYGLRHRNLADSKPDCETECETVPPTTTTTTGPPPTKITNMTYFDAPTPKWVANFLPMANGNGLVWAPDDSLVYTTAVDATIGAFNPDDGSIYNTFQPSAGDGTVPLYCNGEVDFSSDGSSLIYAVTEGDSCKVYALSHQQMDVLWTSPALEGTCEGTPKYADDDAYVFIIHNSAGGTQGHFSVLDTTAGASQIYTFSSPNGPFGPFGFTKDPLPGGNYGADGAGNTNDMAIWGNKPSPDAMGGETGSIWAFQMPPSTSTGEPAVTQLIATTGWRYSAPPLFANNGLYLYWLVSRSQLRAWYGSPFSDGADGEFGFDRGIPPFKAAPYTPAVDNNDSPTIMCGGPANPEFACFSATNINETGGGPLWTASTDGTGVFGDPIFSPSGDRVYWTDNAGVVRTAESATGTGGWTAPSGVSLEANPELSSDGARFFFADTGGNVVCWEVAEGTLGPVNLPPLVQSPPTTTGPLPTPRFDCGENPLAKLETGCPCFDLARLTTQLDLKSAEYCDYYASKPVDPDDPCKHLYPPSYCHFYASAPLTGKESFSISFSAVGHYDAEMEGGYCDGHVYDDIFSSDGAVDSGESHSFSIHVEVTQQQLVACQNVFGELKTKLEDNPNCLVELGGNSYYY